MSDGFDERLDQLERALKVVKSIEGNSDLQARAFEWLVGMTSDDSGLSEKRTHESPESESGGGRSSHRSTSPRSRKTNSPNKSAKPGIFTAIDEFPAVVAGAIPYHQMPREQDKLLWALSFVKEHDIKGITNADAVWLTNELGAGISSKALTDRFERLRRAGYANRSTIDHTIRITPQGEEMLKSIGTKD